MVRYIILSPVDMQLLVIYLVVIFKLSYLFNATNCTMSEWVKVTQSCLTLCDPVDCSLPGFSAHGISQARVLEWVVISFSRGSSQPRDQIQVSSIVGGHFTIWAAGKPHSLTIWQQIKYSDRNKRGNFSMDNVIGEDGF